VDTERMANPWDWAVNSALNKDGLPPHKTEGKRFASGCLIANWASAIEAWSRLGVITGRKIATQWCVPGAPAVARSFSAAPTRVVRAGGSGFDCARVHRG